MGLRLFIKVYFIPHKNGIVWLIPWIYFLCLLNPWTITGCTWSLHNHLLSTIALHMVGVCRHHPSSGSCPQLKFGSCLIENYLVPYFIIPRAVPNFGFWVLLYPCFPNISFTSIMLIASNSNSMLIVFSVVVNCWFVIAAKISQAEQFLDILFS